jgi:hypothetical protein
MPSIQFVGERKEHAESVDFELMARGNSNSKVVPKEVVAWAEDRGTHLPPQMTPERGLTGYRSMR